MLKTHIFGNSMAATVSIYPISICTTEHIQQNLAILPLLSQQIRLMHA